MTYLRLTEAYGGTVYVNPRYIISLRMDSTDGTTVIETTGGEPYETRDSMEVVMSLIEQAV